MQKQNGTLQRRESQFSPRLKRRPRDQQSVVRDLFRRQALGRKGEWPLARGLPRTPSRLRYSLSDVIPIGQRHDRVLLGFTGDGEHLKLCCGPVDRPVCLELRRVCLQWPGLSRPGEASWALPLNPHILEEHDSEGDAEGGALLGRMGMGNGQPASVVVTESSDGFLMIVVVSMHNEEERGDHEFTVFIVPGPSYIDEVHASPGFPFIGAAFTYIAPFWGGARSPVVAAHDMGTVAVDEEGRGGAGRVYVIVLNAMDTFHVLEVTLHMEGDDLPPDPLSKPRAPPAGAKFTMRPTVSPETVQSAGGRGNESSTQGAAQASSPTMNFSSGVSGPSSGSASSGSRASASWWACGQSLPSAPLINAQPAPCRPPRQSSAPDLSDLFSTSVEARAAGNVSGRQNRHRTARASMDRSRQRVFDVEVFISHLVKQPRAFFATTAEERRSSNTESGKRDPRDGRRRLPQGAVADRRMVGLPGDSHPLPTDYHCETVGLMDGGCRVLLCLVVELLQFDMFPTGNKGMPQRIGYLLSLDLGSGEVSIMARTYGRSSSELECSAMCGSLVRAIRRRREQALDLQGYRVSNSPVFYGCSLKAIINPVFPVEIVAAHD